MSESLPFSEVAQIVRGVSFDKNEAQSNPKAGYVPILRAGNIQEFLNTTTDLVWVPETCVSEGQLLRRGDIAIAVSSGSASLVGKTAPLEQDWYGSVGAFCAIIRPKLGVSSTYLSQWFRSAAFDSWRTSKTRGANIQNLQIADLAEARIALPTLEVQVQRAACVAEQMAYSRAARMAVEDQAALAALFLKAELGRAFGGGVPVLASVQLGKAPSGWSWHRIGSWARLESGHTPSRRHPEWWGGGVPWLALPDIRKLHGKLAYETTENTNDAGLKNSSARLLPVGTVCVSRTASIGFVTVLGRPMATSQDFCNWVCNPETLDPEFLMYAFMASQDSLRELGSGAVHKTIYMPTIQSFQICAPAIEEQRRIAGRLRERLAAAEALSQRLRERQAEIAQLPRRLLAAAFEPVA